AHGAHITAIGPATAARASADRAFRLMALVVTGPPVAGIPSAERSASRWEDDRTFARGTEAGPARQSRSRRASPCRFGRAARGPGRRARSADTTPAAGPEPITTSHELFTDHSRSGHRATPAPGLRAPSDVRRPARASGGPPHRRRS